MTTRNFVGTSFGTEAITACLPCSYARPIQARRAALVDMLLGIHIIHEERKLDTMSADSLAVGTFALAPVMAQIFTWIGWSSWAEVYTMEDALLADISQESGKSLFFSCKFHTKCSYQICQQVWWARNHLNVLL